MRPRVSAVSTLDLYCRPNFPWAKIWQKRLFSWIWIQYFQCIRLKAKIVSIYLNLYFHIASNMMHWLFEEVVWKSLILQHYWLFVFLISWQNQSLMPWIRAPRSLGSWGRSSRHQLLRNSTGLQLKVRLARARPEILKDVARSLKFFPIHVFLCMAIFAQYLQLVWRLF